MLNPDVDVYTKTLNPRKTKKDNHVLKTKTILNRNIN